MEYIAPQYIISNHIIIRFDNFNYITMRTIEEVVRNQKEGVRKQPGFVDVEFLDIYYKLRNDIHLTERENEILKLYHKKDF